MKDEPTSFSVLANKPRDSDSPTMKGITNKRTSTLQVEDTRNLNSRLSQVSQAAHGSRNDGYPAQPTICKTSVKNGY